MCRRRESRRKRNESTNMRAHAVCYKKKKNELSFDSPSIKIYSQHAKLADHEDMMHLFCPLIENLPVLISPLENGTLYLGLKLRFGYSNSRIVDSN